jgi:hypothetical protein
MHKGTLLDRPGQNISPSHPLGGRYLVGTGGSSPAIRVWQGKIPFGSARQSSTSPKIPTPETLSLTENVYEGIEASSGSSGLLLLFFRCHLRSRVPSWFRYRGSQRNWWREAQSRKSIPFARTAFLSGEESPESPKAELVAWQYTSGDELDLTQSQQTLPRNSLTVVTTSFVVNAVFTAAAASVSFTITTIIAFAGYNPQVPPPSEDLISQAAERVRALGSSASVSQLLEMRQHLLAKKAPSRSNRRDRACPCPRAPLSRFHHK